MKLKQSIGDFENQLKEVDRGIEDYNQAHDELKLEEIEYEMCFLFPLLTHGVVEAMTTTRMGRTNRKVGNTIQPWIKTQRGHKSNPNQKKRNHLAKEKRRFP